MTLSPGSADDRVSGQATHIVSSQKPQSGVAPKGAYYNSSTLSLSFFSPEERTARNHALVDRMPFLYRLICAKINGNYKPNGLDEPADPSGNLERDKLEVSNNEEVNDDDLGDSLDDLVNLDGTEFKRSCDPAIRQTVRAQTIAQMICAMVAFGGNRRHNGLKLSNLQIFLAAGVTERVSSYLNYIGLASSRQTAHAALKTLGTEGAQKLTAQFELSPTLPLMPFLCYDNLDFQEKVHMNSVERTSTMFHGTWGYIHSPPSGVLADLDQAELTIGALNDALHNGSKLIIRPEMFTPSRDSSKHWEKTMKSQITQVILQYIATPADIMVPLQRDPPPVNTIVPEDPQVHVLKLMLASDNSAAGVNDVFTGVIQQSGLTPKEFHSRLHIIEGDLGACNILDSLRRQRVPSIGNQDSLENILPIPGAEHTLWNISQAIFLAHWEARQRHGRMEDPTCFGCASGEAGNQEVL
ncbi:hypothetical protein PGT21_012310 [Puccinia graminis f. sp. tritici]|uniref:DUF6589 domain-containing protein n=1 Tax=Puccinia graminis f. sp. tritici TaxID=56615 RepID=A0A5B0PQW9_PUCGR|nr:hypothetical protein PGT21_012310 [Puccinia graminis f. sp. tritici]